MAKLLKQPCILVTGTPGTGKTSLSSSLAEKLHLAVINIGEFAKEHDCYEAYDDEYETHILDEDKLLDLLEPLMDAGGVIVDFHSCDLFPERWFDLILVLRTETAQLYDRLVARNYNDKKLNENMECEIMQVVLESARESYPEEILVELFR